MLLDDVGELLRAGALSRSRPGFPPRLRSHSGAALTAILVERQNALPSGSLQANVPSTPKNPYAENEEGRRRPAFLEKRSILFRKNELRLLVVLFGAARTGALPPRAPRSPNARSPRPRRPDPAARSLHDRSRTGPSHCGARSGSRPDYPDRYRHSGLRGSCCSAVPCSNVCLDPPWNPPLSGNFPASARLQEACPRSCGMSLALV